MRLTGCYLYILHTNYVHGSNTLSLTENAGCQCSYVLLCRVRWSLFLKGITSSPNLGRLPYLRIQCSHLPSRRSEFNLTYFLHMR